MIETGFMGIEWNQNRGFALQLAVLLVLMCGPAMLQAREISSEQPPAVIDLSPEYSTEPADREACRLQLHRIQEALDWYRESNDNVYPPSLTDLLGIYLTDVTILTCPFVARTGSSREWRHGLRAEVWDDQQTMYTYEFSRNAMHLYGKLETTPHDYKLRQIEFLNQKGADGGVVPVVRCFAHRPVLNLSYSGIVYQSDIHWEDRPEFTRLGITHDDLMESSLFADEIRNSMRRLDYPPRDPLCGPGHLDLTSHYNAALTMAWHPASPGNDLTDLPRGLQDLDAHTYDVRGVIQLKGNRLRFPFPEQITGIEVGRSCRRIHFLHATAFEELTGTRIGHYLIRYVDGLEREVPILYGRDVEDWWYDLKPGQPATACTVAWRGSNEPTRAQGMGIRLYHSEWENPREKVEIASIDFVSAMTDSGPFLVAITVE
jgi:hypothetical protein